MNRSVPGSGAVRTLFGRGSVFTIATACQMSAAVLIMPVITRLLSKTEFGHVATSLVVVQILMFLVALGLPSAITLEYFDRRGGLSAARSLVVLSIGVAIVMAAAIDLLGPVWTRWVFSGLSYHGALRVAVWSTVPMSVVVAAQALLRATDRAAPFIVVTAISTAGAQLLGFCFVTFGAASATSYMLGVGLGLTVAAAAGLVLCGIDLSRVRDGRLIRAALHVGIPTIPHAMGVYLVGAGDRIIIQRLEGLGPVARYQVAYLVGALGLTLAGALNNAWGPLVYGTPADRRWDVLAETTAGLYRLAGVVASGIAIGAPLALLAVAPGSYHPRALAPVCAVVALSLIPFVGYLSNAYPIFHYRKVWALAWSTPLSAAVNVVLNLVLVPRFGLIGAAYATVLTYGSQALLARRAARKLVTVPWRRGLATRAWAVALTGVAVGALLPATGAWLALRGALAAALVVLFARRVRALLSGAPAPAPAPGPGAVTV